MTLTDYSCDLRRDLHSKLCANQKLVTEFFADRLGHARYPIYSSYDIRDAGYKITNVDGNVYPAGFNNICPQDKAYAPELVKTYLHSKYGNSLKRIYLVTEEHMSNTHYWENILSLNEMLEKAGFEIQIGIPRLLTSPLLLQSTSGVIVEVLSAHPHSDHFKEFAPDLIISNNDFSQSYGEWANELQIPIDPPRELGWYQRKKSSYFFHYNRLAGEFAKNIGVDPFQLQVETELFANFDISDPESRNALADQVDKVLARLKGKYVERGIQQEPFVFVKNNSGTYGLAVIRVSSGSEVRTWSYKSRKKMKAAKGGRDVEEVIIQEGIPTIHTQDGMTSEPVIYLIGKSLAGGFLRSHSEKGSEENLNSPGSVFKRLCLSDLQKGSDHCLQENTYGCVAQLGLLAITQEAQYMDQVFYYL